MVNTLFCLIKVGCVPFLNEGEMHMSIMNCKIYVDGLFFKGSGIGRYYESIVKGLAEEGFKIYTCVPRRYEKEWKKIFSGVDTVVPYFVDWEKFSFKGLLLQSAILKKFLGEVGVFLFPHVNIPVLLNTANVVITIHDLRPYTKFWDRSLLKRAMFSTLMKFSLFVSKKVVVVSESVKVDVLKRFMIRDDKLCVIYEFPEIDAGEYMLRNFVPNMYILYVGNRKKHKNLDNLLYAFKKLRQIVKCHLVIAGSKDVEGNDYVDAAIKRLGLRDVVIQFTRPSDEELYNLYKGAKLLILPSFLEGFGLTPVEAISCGCPALTSNISVLREIYEDEIACFNPNSHGEIFRSILRFLLVPKYRRRLLLHGKYVIKYKLDRKKILEKYLDIFSSISSMCGDSL